MKKILAVVAIVCAAACANAATVTWGTGNGIKPDGTSAAAGTVSIYVWTVSESVYNNTNIADIWKDYGKTSIDELAASATTSKQSLNSMGGSAKSENVANSTTLYGIILIAYDGNKDGTVDMYIANKAVGSVNSTGGVSSPNNLSKYIGGGSSGTPVTWGSASVPEPTSAMLMLLGAAGLALRRKRA